MTSQSKTEHLPLKISNADYHIKRIRIGVIFGGRSVEHEVSLVSAASVLNALDPKLYEIIPIGIAADGHWLSSGDA